MTDVYLKLQEDVASLVEATEDIRRQRRERFNDIQRNRDEAFQTHFDFRHVGAQTPTPNMSEPVSGLRGAVNASVAPEEAHQQPIPFEGSSNPNYNVGYVCVECLDREDLADLKWWPRLDNFKSHVRRKHPSANLQAVIQA